MSIWYFVWSNLCLAHTRLMEMARLKRSEAEESAVQSAEKEGNAWLEGDSVLHRERGHLFRSYLLNEVPHSAATVYMSVF